MFLSSSATSVIAVLSYSFIVTTTTTTTNHHRHPFSSTKKNYDTNTCIPVVHSSNTALAMAPIISISTYVASTAAICATFAAIQFQRRIQELENELNRKSKIISKASKVADYKNNKPNATDSNKNSIVCVPIGRIESVYRLCVGTPRQGMLAPNSRGRVVLDPTRIRPDSLDALDQYSHLWVVFEFHLNTNDKIVKKAASSGNNTFPSKVRLINLLI